MKLNVFHKLRPTARKVVGLPAIILTVFLVVIMFGMAQLGGSAKSSEAQDTVGTPVKLMTLRVEEQIAVQRHFLGRIEARQSAALAFEFGGTIDFISVQEGSRVKQGDVLAVMNTDTLMVQRDSLVASLEAAQSQVDAARSEVSRVRRLVSSGAAPSNRLTTANAEAVSRTAELTDVQRQLDETNLRLDKSQLIAPFNGIVGERAASLGETVGAGQTVVSIFEDGSSDFRVGVPTTLPPETLRNPRIRINDKEYPVRLRAIRPDIDFRSNTRIAIFEVLTSDLVSFGLSATLVGDVIVEARGAWVPLDAMRPSAEGYWIILAVDEDMVARRVAVEVQHLRDDEAYVMGAFNSGTQIIAKGAHKVVPGQTVRSE